MTKRKVWRYRCEFCPKSGCSAHWIIKHEQGCTANPNRSCGLCAHAGLGQRPITELLACIDRKKPDCGIGDLRTLTQSCPACMLAAIRQSGICKWDGDPDGTPAPVNFDFKAETKSFWDAENDARAVEEYRYEASYL